MTGAERDTMQQSTGVGRGGGKGGGTKVSNNLSMLFACAPSLYSRYLLSYVFRLILLMDRGSWLRAYSAGETKQRSVLICVVCFYSRLNLTPYCSLIYYRNMYKKGGGNSSTYGKREADNYPGTERWTGLRNKVTPRGRFVLKIFFSNLFRF